ncbi:MAG: hypothetical protein ACD_73C00114G0003 [uncultured bacterium]|nr:MAG: hypothetical protein ACD_73C00114G0003 [uncultured bacterium]
MEFNLSPTVIWAILGIILIVVELVSFSFVLLFFGLAALIVSALKLLGLNHLTGEIFIFAILGIAGVFFFRSRLLANVKPQSTLLTDVNQQIVLSHDIPAGKSARINYQGTTWTAHNEAAKDLKKGDAVIIERIDGINLYVKVVDI